MLLMLVLAESLLYTDIFNLNLFDVFDSSRKCKRIWLSYGNILRIELIPSFLDYNLELEFDIENNLKLHIRKQFF